MDTTHRFLHPVLAPALLFVALATSAVADPLVSAGMDVIVQGTVSTRVDDFWSLYPQYAAQDNPFLRARFGIQDESWKVEMEFDFLQQYTSWRSTNLPLPDPDGRRAFPVEYHGLRVGDFVYNFHPLVVAIGRNKVHWGPTKDSLIVADQIPFLDRIALHLPMGDWTFDSLIASPETRTNPSSPVGTQTWYSVSTMQVAHRLSWRTDNWEFGFTEQSILDRNEYDENGTIIDKGAYSITDFLPFSLTHETDLRPFNSMMIFDVSWKLGRWKLAAETGFDEFDARTFGIPDDPIPTIWAQIIELSWTNDPWSWTLSVGRTHYLWGNYDSFYGKADYRILLDNGVQTQPLTSPYGPGATWGTLAFHYQGHRITFDGRAEFWSVLKGVSLDTPYVDDSPARKFDFYGRAHLFATFERGDLSFTLGPQLLFANGLLTEQWFVQLTDTFGSR